MSNIHAESAIGLISTRSFPAMVGTADMMIKSAAVTLVGYEKIGGGYCTAVIRGRFPDVKLAVAAGAEVAEQMDELICQSVISRPFPNLDAVLPISDRILAQIVGKSKLNNLAIGLLETRGFPAMVGAMADWSTGLSTVPFPMPGPKITAQVSCADRELKWCWNGTSAKGFASRPQSGVITNTVLSR